jgi:hypothetical protein
VVAKYVVVPAATVAVVATVPKTVLQIRGTTAADLYVARFRVSFDEDTAATAGARVRVLRQTTDGTGTAGPENRTDESTVAAAFTSFYNFSAEPTAGEVLEDMYAPAYNGVYESPEVPMPDLASMYRLQALTTARVGIEVTVAANCNCLAEMWVWQ